MANTATGPLDEPRRPNGPGTPLRHPFTAEQHKEIVDRIAELHAEKHPVLKGGFASYMNNHGLSYTGVRGTKVLWDDDVHYAPLAEILGIRIAPAPEPVPEEKGFDPDSVPE